jgi:hypothetical protein
MPPLRGEAGMFGSQILEVVVGLMMFFVLLSIACSGATGAVLGALFVKERNMSRGMRHVVSVSDDAQLATRLFAHPLVRSLEGRRTWLSGLLGFRRPTPLEIPAPVFRVALVDALVPGGRPELAEGVADTWAARLDAAIAALPENDGLARLLAALRADAAVRGEPVHLVVERWYEAAVEAVKERYRRSARTWSLAVCLLAVLAINADALMMFDVMSKDVALRTVLAHAAELQTTAAAVGAEQAAAAVEAGRAVARADGLSGALGVPLGWDPAAPIGAPRALPVTVLGWMRKAVGLFISAFAGALGANFWFDLIKRVVTARRALDAAAEPADAPAQA